MKTYQDVKMDGDNWISLVKLTGKKIVDIEGYVTKESYDPFFCMTNVILEDGTKIGCEGEHDLPYLDAYNLPEMRETVLENIYKTDPDHADDE